MKKMQEDMLVSVCMLVYNHELYLAQALKSILMQKTTFEFEIVLSEDCSTDNTRSICLEYKERYPGKIKLITSDRNIGAHANAARAMQNCTGKYIAFLEGDDYWTDSDKLQKQVDFIETHPEYSYVCARYGMLDESTGEIKSVFDDLFSDGKDKIITVDNFFNPYISKTLTVLLRRDFLKDLNYRFKYFGDTFLFFHLLQHGKGFCMNLQFGIYRIHSGGMWSVVNTLHKARMSYFLSCNFLIFYGRTHASVIKFHKACFYQHLWNTLETNNLGALMGLYLSEFKLAIMRYDNNLISTIKATPGFFKKLILR